MGVCFVFPGKGGKLTKGQHYPRANTLSIFLLRVFNQDINKGKQQLNAEHALCLLATHRSYCILLPTPSHV